MPGPTPVMVQGDQNLPDKVDVVVIGGGIVGSSTALELAQQGLSVALCEKGGIAQEQSSRNWGWVRISRRDSREVPLMAHALTLWRDLETRSGRDVGYRRNGISFVCHDDATLENFTRWQRHLEPHGIASRILSPKEMRELDPQSQIEGLGALYTPDDGYAEPQKAAPAIAELARSKGVHILTACAARVVETAAGQVSAVVTERGMIRCNAAVVACGAWSNLFLGNLGIDLPALNVAGHVLRTDPADGGPKDAVWTKEFTIRKRQDGGYTIARGGANTVDIVPNSFRYMMKFRKALRDQYKDLHFRLGRQFWQELSRAKGWSGEEVTAFEKLRVWDPAPNPGLLKTVMTQVAQAFPGLGDVQVAQYWSGMMDVTADAVPVISDTKTPGLFIASGFSGHGFGIGLGAGRLMADLVSGNDPVVDPQAFRLSRFSDGSPIAPESEF